MAGVTFPVDLGGDGSTVTDDSNPTTGLRRGGYQTRFVPALQNLVAIGEVLVDRADEVATNTSAVVVANSQAGASAAAAAQSATGAAQSLQDTQVIADEVAATAALVQGVSGARAFATYALALAVVGTLDPNQVVIVAKDETRSNLGSYYQVSGGTLLFLRAEEVYVSPVSYIPTQSLNDIITTLLVKAGMIPNDQPTLFADLGNDAYFA